MRTISFSDLKIGDTARRYMQRALEKNWVSEGENVREFEQKFAEKFGYGHAIAVSSGTDACACACAALYDIGAHRGDEIIVPACTFVATANAVLAAGFTPRFVDVELETLNIDPSKIEDAITKRTVALMPAHIMGKMAKLDEIMSIAPCYLRVIEDACFTPECVVWHNFGAKSISDVSVGDKVLSRDGQFRKVLRIFRRQYSGPLVNLKLRYNSSPVRVTPNHRFLAVRPPKVVNRETLRRVVRHSQPQWIEAGNLEIGDFVALAKPRRRIATPLVLEWQTKTNAKGRKVERIEVTPEIMRLFGYYLAEGYWNNPHWGCLYFDSNDMNAIDDCCSLIQLLGRRPFLYKTQIGETSIRFSASGLSGFFKSFGSRATDKRIPEVLLGLSDAHVLQLLKGLFLGDACLKHNRLLFSTSSEKLVHQVYLLLVSLGFIATLMKVKSQTSVIRGKQVKNKGGWSLQIKGKQLHELFTLMDIESVGRHRGEFAIRQKEYILIPIKERSIQTYNGLVHNLEVEDDPSYSIFGATVHNCEAHGAQYKGRLVGTYGDMAAFSFYAGHLMVCGEGGMVVTNDAMLADIVRSVRSHGRPAGSLYFQFDRFGFNSKMNDMEAAIGLQSLEDFDETFRRRRENLHALLDMVKDLEEHCYFIKEGPDEIISPFVFPLVLRDETRDVKPLYTYLEANGIQCKTLFGSLPTQHGAFKFLGHRLGDFPVAEYIGHHGLQFGIHQYLTEDDLVYISDILHQYFKEYR